MKRFVIGDIHGMYDKLMEVLKISGFDYENDLLIQIGDIVDRGPEPFKCMDELMKIKNTILIRGNHDYHFLEWIDTGHCSFGGGHGARATQLLYKELSSDDQAKYKAFLGKQIYYYIDEKNNCFVHGGFNKNEFIAEQSPFEYVWDRKLLQQAMSCKGKDKLKTADNFDRIYVGHTPTVIWDIQVPFESGGVYNVDTGAGLGDKLTIMNIDTDNYWQSKKGKT